MAIFLRILTILYLLLSIAAFALGSMLFTKRELLKGRTQMLENTLIEVAGFIEEEDAPEVQNDFEARDLSDVTAQPLAQDEIEFSDFFKSYSLQLEDQERSLVELGSKRQELMTYYKRDFSGNVEKDPTGYPITSGTGTMHDLLEKLKERVQKQHTRLNLTREQLKIVREELVDTIGELNERKTTLRERLAEIVDLNSTIAELTARNNELEGKISGLEREIRQLVDDVAIRDDQIRKLDEDLKVKEADIAALKQEIQELTTIGEEEAGAGAIRAGRIDPRVIQTGSKGTVVNVNEQWGYVVFAISQEFVAELEQINATLTRHLAEDELPSVPPVELLVRRGESFETFVSKVRLRQVDNENLLAIGDILQEWQQNPVSIGDGVFY